MVIIAGDHLHPPSHQYHPHHHYQYHHHHHHQQDGKVHPVRQGFFHPEDGSLAVSSITPLPATAHLQIHHAQLHHSEIHSSEIIDSPSVGADYLLVKRSADFQGDVHVDGDLTVHGTMYCV